MVVMSSIWTIRRSTSDAKFAGVCGGVARHWNVDPVLVRVGWVLLALSGGIGLVLYIAGWLLIPADGKDRPVIHDLLGEQAGKLSREVWVAIVVLACVVSVAAFGTISPFGFGPALILAVIWYFGYYRTKVRKSPSPPPARPASPASPPVVPSTQQTQFYSYPGPPTAFTQAADAWRERIIQVQRQTSEQRPASGSPVSWTAQPAAPAGSQAGDYQASGHHVGDNQGAPTPTVASRSAVPQSWAPAVAEDRSEPTGWAQPPEATDQQAFLAHPDPVGLYSPEPVVTPVVIKQADRPSARRLRLVGLIALGLTLTALAIADSAGLAVPAPAYLAASLLVIGLVLIAATWFGRARAILPVGIILALVTAAAVAAPQVPAPTEWQPQQVAYTSPATLPAGGDHFDVASAHIDLSRLALTKDTTYAATLDLGNLAVTVPPEVNVVVDYSLDAGTVKVFDQQVASGTELKSVLPAATTDPTKPTLTLKLTADVGQIEVNR
jgi:phage shock protein PspC (stress-responsive transcriptional regulator)